MNNPAVSDDVYLLMSERDFSELDRDVSKHEIENILKKLKNGKFTGFDEIPYEIYKWGGVSMIEL